MSGGGLVVSLVTRAFYGRLDSAESTSESAAAAAAAAQHQHSLRFRAFSYDITWVLRSIS